MATVRVTHIGMEGEGRTLAAAKQDAARKAEAALTGEYTPHYVKHAGSIAVIAREPQYGWGYRIIYPDSSTSDALFLQGQGGTANSKKDVIESAAWHLAQNAGHYDGLEAIIPAKRRNELDRYFESQARYKEAIDRGMSDEEARSYAFGTPSSTNQAKGPRP
jgi:hypothetical protein